MDIEVEVERECFNCSKVISPFEPYVNHCGNFYLPPCFTCVICNQDFTKTCIYTDKKEKKPYCHEHYIETFAPTCDKCQKKIVGKVVRARGGKAFHPHCFCCEKCGAQLVGKGSYGLFEGNPYCPIHTPFTKKELEQEAQRTRGEFRARYQQLMLDIDLVLPDESLSSLYFDSDDPINTMGLIVEILGSVEEVGDEYEREVKRKSMERGVEGWGGGKWKLVRDVFGFLSDGSVGSVESKSAGVQTLWKLGAVQPQVFKLCGAHDALSHFLLPMIESKNSEALFLATTFLGKMCGVEGSVPEDQLKEVFNEGFIDTLLNYVLHYDVEDDGEPENVQSLMVSRATIGALVGIHYQFSSYQDDIVIQRIIAHEFFTTLASRILTRFNLGLDAADLRVMKRFFEGSFALQTGRLFFSADLKVVMEICARFLCDPSDFPVDHIRRAYLDLVELFISSEEDGGEGWGGELREALKWLTEPGVVDPVLGERGGKLLEKLDK